MQAPWYGYWCILGGRRCKGLSIRGNSRMELRHWSIHPQVSPRLHQWEPSFSYLRFASPTCQHHSHRMPHSVEHHWRFSDHLTTREPKVHWSSTDHYFDAIWSMSNCLSGANLTHEIFSPQSFESESSLPSNPHKRILMSLGWRTIKRNFVLDLWIDVCILFVSCTRKCTSWSGFPIIQ